MMAGAKHSIVSVLLGVAIVFIAIEAKASEISCGGHRAANCQACSGVHGSSWCHGECLWCNGGCQLKTKTCEGTVSCGGHRAANCQACPGVHGSSWCHGDCLWCNGGCQLKTKTCEVTMEIPKSCPDLKFGSIPSDHLFHKKKKPVIIAHRGQPMKFQENTLEGIRSVTGLKADGYELDIYKTKDDKLVVFHDDNTMRMTGVSKIVWESTYEELQQLNLTTSVKAGDKTITYDKPRKIPLLEDVLKEMKKTNLVHYLEMKPSEYQGDDELTRQTGKMVAQLVTKMGLQRRAIIVSFDWRKVHHVKTENPKLTVGILYWSGYSKDPKPTQQLINTFPKYKKCFLDAPSGNMEFFKFALYSGLLFKLTGCSSFDADLNLYSDRRFSDNLVAMMRKNYSPDISTGFYTMYSQSNVEKENIASEKKLLRLLKQGGAQRLISDDVPRVRRFLKKHKLL